MTRLLLLLALAACTDTTYDYEPTTAGEAEGDTRAPRAKTSTQFLRGVYADLLGRSPESYELTVSFQGSPAFAFQLDEEAQLSGALDGIGDSAPLRNLVVAGLVNSEELQLPAKADVEAGAFIRDQFRRFLGREPNAYELAVFTDEWARDPAVGPRTVIRAITGSREYQSQ